MGATGVGGTLLTLPRVKMTVAYDGTDFGGWQVQPGLRSVQGEVERCLKLLNKGSEIRVHASGRTDKGAHARGQVFHFDPTRAYSPDKWLESMNGVLADDVRILDVSEVAPRFHARISATGKEYRYFVSHGRILPPDLRHTHLFVLNSLDVPAMQAAAALFVGKKDFLSFSSDRGIDESTTRMIFRSDWLVDGHELVFRVAGNGFLYKMVRQMVGSLLRVGRGDLHPEDIERLLARPQRSADAPTAPAHGLTLWHVTYSDCAE